MVDTRFVHLRFADGLIDTYQSDDFDEPDIHGFPYPSEPYELIDLAIENNLMIDQGATKAQLESFKAKFTRESTWKEVYDVYTESSNALKNARKRGERLEGWDDEKDQSEGRGR